MFSIDDNWIEDCVRGFCEGIRFKGTFHLEHWRNGQLLKKYEIKNTVTTEGKNLNLNVVFGATAKPTAWYIGLIDNASYSGNAVTDTMSSHTDWTEWTTYSEATRQQWVTGTAANGLISNPTAATFSITGSGTLGGIFISTSNTKGGTSGTLWSGASFVSTVPVQNGDQIKVTYTINCP